MSKSSKKNIRMYIQTFYFVHEVSQKNIIFYDQCKNQFLSSKIAFNEIFFISFLHSAYKMFFRAKLL
jgi:hypothetical protein